MPLKKIALLIAVGAALFAETTQAEPVLSVQFQWVSSKEPAEDGFEVFKIDSEAETIPTVPLSNDYGSFNVKLSGAGELVTDEVSEEPGKLVVRRRELTPENKDFPYHRLFQDWVGSHKTMALQISGLEPSRKYRATFYAYDFKDGSTGADVIQNALDANQNPVTVSWSGDDKPDASTPLDKHSAPLEVESSAKGHLLFTITRDPGVTGDTALLNGFQIEEIK